MKILLLTQYYPPEVGAAQARLAGIANELVRAGHTVEVVTALPNYPGGRIYPDYKGRLYIRETHQGVKVHRSWVYASSGAGFLRALNYCTFVVTAWIGIALSAKPDLIFAELPPLVLSPTAVLAAWLLGAILVSNVSDLWPDSVFDMGLVRSGLLAKMLLWLESWTYKRSDFVCATTRGIYDTLEHIKQVPHRKLLYLPNGVDVTTLKPSRPDEDMRQKLGLVGKSVIVYAGTHGLAHGMAVLLDVAQELHDDDAFHFLFVGDGSSKRRLMESAKRRGLTNVTFIDPVPPSAIRSLYSFALCGIVSLADLPILASARPAKVLAAMACGRPVVLVTRNPASLVKEANAGLIADSADPQSVANAIRTLRRNPALADQLGRNGRSYVEEHMTWRTTVKNWLQQLDSRTLPPSDAKPQKSARTTLLTDVDES